MSRKTKFALAALLIFSILLIAAVIVISSPEHWPPGGPTVVARATVAARPTAAGSGTAALGRRTKTKDCQALGSLPDPACTPGEVLTTDTAQICAAGYASSVRAVTQSTKDKVYAEYGVTTHKTGDYEIDHLVSLELGGSNGIANLWPEADAVKPGFREKDQVEGYLHRQVCSGKMSIEDAQYQMATDWVAIYDAITP